MTIITCEKAQHLLKENQYHPDTKPEDVDISSTNWDKSPGKKSIQRWKAEVIILDIQIYREAPGCTG